MTDRYLKLCSLLRERQGALYVALSGGIDSITLMRIAAQVRSAPTVAVHAVSAAVPDDATERCRALAAKYQWQLREIDAREFDDPDYLRNPHNRCYYCKRSLFRAMAVCIEVAGTATLATGTNTDDLGDYRPGLQAAAEQQVWQPYVEAQVDKHTLRDMAREQGLGELAELPAAPCLSSRVETGIAIDAGDLKLIHQVEKLVTGLTGPGDIRCRIMQRGVIVQLPADSLIFVDQRVKTEASSRIGALCAQAGKPFVDFEEYVRGSAFIKPRRVIHEGV
jgi:uncharacterized protein